MTESTSPFERRLCGLIDTAGDRATPRALREFALWCARLTEPELPGPRAMLETIEDALGTGDADGLARLRTDSAPSAQAAATVGLSRDAPSASAFLAVFAAAHPDPVEAAVQAASHTARWHADCVIAEFAGRLSYPASES